MEFDEIITIKCKGHFESGYKEFEFNYKNGFKHGKSKWWYPSGNKCSSVNYKNGKRDGIEKSWYSNGKLEYIHKINNEKLIYIFRSEEFKNKFKSNLNDRFKDDRNICFSKKEFEERNKKFNEKVKIIGKDIYFNNIIINKIII